MRPARVKRANELLSRKAGVELEQTGYVALTCLEQAGALRLTDLAEACGVDLSTMSRLADRLFAAGLLEPGGGSTDRRVVCVQLSPQGQQTLLAVRKVRQEALDRALRDWTEDDRMRLAELLDRFANSLEGLVREELAEIGTVSATSPGLQGEGP
jgi:DNA-binding MarR family transcriptional regulator